MNPGVTPPSPHLLLSTAVDAFSSPLGSCFIPRNVSPHCLVLRGLIMLSARRLTAPLHGLSLFPCCFFQFLLLPAFPHRAISHRERIRLNRKVVSGCRQEGQQAECRATAPSILLAALTSRAQRTHAHSQTVRACRWCRRSCFCVCCPLLLWACASQRPLLGRIVLSTTSAFVQSAFFPH